MITRLNSGVVGSASTSQQLYSEIERQMGAPWVRGCGLYECPSSPPTSAEVRDPIGS